MLFGHWLKAWLVEWLLQLGEDDQGAPSPNVSIATSRSSNGELMICMIELEIESLEYLNSSLLMSPWASNSTIFEGQGVNYDIVFLQGSGCALEWSRFVLIVSRLLLEHHFYHFGLAVVGPHEIIFSVVDCYRWFTSDCSQYYCYSDDDDDD